ncbi:MAG: PHP domain-containing protein [Deltaproteobacteria bacterium]|nr:PHP domain-containing protein [Deltaproteobacteria bacterium]
MGAIRTLVLVLASQAWACSGGPGAVTPSGVSVVPGRAAGSRAGAAGWAALSGKRPISLAARPGDIVLDNRRTQAVIAAARRRPGFGELRGSLVDIGVHDLSTDKLRRFVPSLEIEGSRRRVTVDEVRPVRGSLVPAVEVNGTVRWRRARFRIRTVFRLPGPTDAIEVVTRVESHAQRSVRMRVVDEVAWDDAPAFVPGIGRIERSRSASVAWFARAHSAVSYAYAARAAVDVRFEVEPMHGGPNLARAIVRSAQTRVPRGGTLRVVRELVAVRGDVALAAAAVSRRRGLALERVRGRTEGLGPGALLSVLDAAERPVVEVHLPADGSFAFDLPAGVYFLETATFGRRPPPRRRIEVGAGITPFVLLPAPDAPSVLAVTVEDGQTGMPMPGRIVVRGRWPTPDPTLGPRGQATGAGYAAHTRTGDIALTLPAGTYRVGVSHGPEWTISGKDVLVRPGDRIAIEAELTRALETPGLVSCDLHLHAAPSPDSQTSIEDRVVSLVAEGVEFAAATDHNHVTDYQPIIDAMGLRGQLVAVSGDEVTTDDPYVGHFNVYPFAGGGPDGDPRVPFAGRTPPEIFSAVRSQAPQAILQVNHPWGDNATGYFVLFGLDTRTGRAEVPYFDLGFDAIEVWNGMWLGDATIMGDQLEGWMQLLALGHRFVGTGNSDSHHMVNQWAGYPRTYALVAEDDPERLVAQEVIDALRAGRAFVTTGPIVRLEVGGGLPGDTVRATDGNVEVVVGIEAAPWVDVRRLVVWVGGRPGEPVPVPPRPAGTALAFEHRVTVPVPWDTFVLVTVEGDFPAHEVLPQFAVGPRAFTNPVWVDANGDGAVDLAPAAPETRADAGGGPALEAHAGDGGAAVSDAATPSADQ